MTLVLQEYSTQQFFRSVFKAAKTVAPLHRRDLCEKLLSRITAAEVSRRWREGTMTKVPDDDKIITTINNTERGI